MRLRQRYYFHVLCNARTVEDETGTVLSDTEAARLHASVIAAELAYKGDKYRDCEVCAVDDDGNEIARMPVVIPSWAKRSDRTGSREMKDANATSALFIDGANLHMTARALGFDIDYRKPLAVFRREAIVLRAFFYAAIKENQARSHIRPLLDWLDYNGFVLISKLTKDFVNESNRRTRTGYG